jgi:predicted alpha/beta-fold hydrolase
MNSKILKEVIEYFYPLIIILLLFFLRYISFKLIIVGYLIYCIFIYYTTKTHLFYHRTEFNKKLINECPSIKNANFKQYFLLPFTICQFFLFQKINDKLNLSRKNQIFYEKQKIDEQGTLLVWASFKNNKFLNSIDNPVLLILPGITGRYNETYVNNIIAEGLKNNYNVAIFQMCTLSDEMKLDKNKHIDFYEDLNNCLIKIKEKNKNKLFAIGYSYGANILTGYLGSKNNETNYIDGGVAVSNPFDLFMSQRAGEDTLYESLICHFERKNYIHAVNSLNKYNENFIDVNVLKSSYSVKIFDKEFFGKLLGYKNGDDYYQGISSARYVKDIKKPLLVIHSKDDPICSFKGIPFDNLCENENIIFIATDKGGHFCYVENEKIIGFSGKLWSFKPSFEFINFLKLYKI